jgi:hypothetical protein
MAHDDPKLPRAVLRGDELFVGDDKKPYTRSPNHTVYLQITDPDIGGGYEPENFGEPRGPKDRVTPWINGLAKIEGRDKFAGAGFDAGKNPKIAFHLRPVSDAETPFLWAARIGYEMHDWEYDVDEKFWIQGYCPVPDFEHVVAAIRTGHVDGLRVGLQTSMWNRDPTHGYLVGPLTFHLAPPTDKESSSPATETGFIHSVT